MSDDQLCGPVCSASVAFVCEVICAAATGGIAALTCIPVCAVITYYVCDFICSNEPEIPEELPVGPYP
jgi:hypothetical protein